MSLVIFLRKGVESMGFLSFFSENRKKQNKEYIKATYEKGPFIIKCPFCFKKFKNDQVVFRAAHFEKGDPEYERR